MQKKSSLMKKLTKYWPFYFLALPGLIYFFINKIGKVYYITPFFFF